MLEQQVTLEEFEALPESVRAEVHEGRLVVRGNTSGEHSVILTRLISSISQQVSKLNRPWEVFSSRYEALLSAEPLVIVEPDLMILTDLSRITSKRYEGAPAVVMEIVSRPEEYIDFSSKTELYRTYGVQEYWIIDPCREKISTCCFAADSPDPAAYSFQDSVHSKACPGIRIDFGEIYQRLRALGLMSGTSQKRE